MYETKEDKDFKEGLKGGFIGGVLLAIISTVLVMNCKNDIERSSYEHNSKSMKSFLFDNNINNKSFECTENYCVYVNDNYELKTLKCNNNSCEYFSKKVKEE